MTAPRDDRADLDEASPLASPDLRLAARTLDVALPFVLLAVLGPVGVALGSPALLDLSALLTLPLWVGIAVLDLVWLHRYGQSVGKRIVGLRIVRTDGTRASLGRLFWLRGVLPGVLGAVPLLGTLFAIVDAGCIFTPDRQTVHDRFADTIVVDLRRDA